MISILKVNKKLFLTIALALAITACRYEFPAGSLLHYGSCKDDQADALKMDADSYLSQQECIHYEYDGLKNLYFTHINADFNCCPRKITSEIVVKNNDIVVTESGDGMCDCICLYDLEYEIRNLDIGIYTLTINAMDDLELEIDLTSNYAGTICAERDGYPWN